MDSLQATLAPIPHHRMWRVATVLCLLTLEGWTNARMMPPLTKLSLQVDLAVVVMMLLLSQQEIQPLFNEKLLF